MTDQKDTTVSTGDPLPESVETYPAPETDGTEILPTTQTVSPSRIIAAAQDSMPVSEEDSKEENDNGCIRLGICAMDKKARSKPMAEILSRLDEDHFRVVFFGDDVILNKPVEEWPICDVLIAFFSKNYPLPKAKEYVALRKPLILNDLEMQELLQDRRRVYDLLEASGIDVPRHAYLSRDGYVSTGTGDGNGNRNQEVQEFDDHIEVNGITIHKPFVEKPVNAEDHKICIYYPTSAGGGCKKLFRKIGNRSSEFYPDINEVRRDGSYIYEEFVETQGTDVKMYTVGPEYGHAEARKSPTVDGKVERNSDGKEVRFPVILTYREKEIARRIVLVFKQFVCGFDILRVQEGHTVVSYVCDVNGFSFVKNSRKYYDDCAQILSEHILALLRPSALRTISTLDPLVKTTNHRDDDITDDTSSKKQGTFFTRAAWMLQGEPAKDDSDDVDSQSMKGEPNASPNRSDAGEMSMTAATTLDEGALPVRDFPGNLTSVPASMAPSSVNSSESEEQVDKKRRLSISLQEPHQEELRCVVAIIRHGDRTPKQKLKVDMSEPHILEYFHRHVKNCTKDLKVKAKAPLTEFLETVKTTLAELERSSQTESLRYQLMHMRDILERWKIVGLNRKLQIKPRKFDFVTDDSGETKQKCIEVQLILKWGGNLTKLGEKQSVRLGQRLRQEMYPDAPGGGILRLHSTFRHDLKIKTSDEGRVMKTAAAFAKGLLELEGDLPPILVSLVHKEKGSMHMLDPSGNEEVKNEIGAFKEKICTNLQRDIDLDKISDEELDSIAGPSQLTSLRSALISIGNPRNNLFMIHKTMCELLTQLGEMLDEMGSGDERRIEGGEGLKGRTDDDVALSGVKLYKGETLLELIERWRFIYERLYDAEKDKFDLSRIPDIHDNVRFDILHNPHLGLSDTLHRLYDLAKPMADCVVPQEYGTTIPEKRSVGVKICHGLLEKIKYDLNIARKDNEVDMRYLINLAYQSDLNINSLGRRVRTRLYFTSESHLHTVLSVLRFCSSEDQKSVLSKEGISIINSTPELCYLTQIIMRVFEDARRPMDDPKRFRVEILFSPGATATPFHMHEKERDKDTSRFDTAPLQMIGRPDLTCQDVEDFLEKVMIAGGPSKNDDLTVDASSMGEPTDQHKAIDFQKVKKREDTAVTRGQLLRGFSEDTRQMMSLEFEPTEEGRHSRSASGLTETEADEILGKDAQTDDGDASSKKDEEDSAKEITSTNRTLGTVGHKYFWGTVAVGSFTLGVYCLVMALNNMSRDARGRKRWSRRH
ncbi:inositol-hexakisphosphate/diphosphoinositol-pentakisphosphate 1-kinase [Fistulifera solaris]|uniref:Inositol hexakisphosphate and diphosphoinositol-pentakisphosphate kinase n=1 Tax=Fistulifera solaris TaxID=1519565 RepID=A0A1Z5K5D5_FISSO|nr:inositol-hexakisphosphate/diphosphoinositol-pentakisphosphate 1-kinase [Fistulifera solaris]|eukprot:GAX21470.1 inositol-hexakisphosphate/diphosphoinositol-pentakisphosphate 1-kinase [Fistulifera solaris]